MKITYVEELVTFSELDIMQLTQFFKIGFRYTQDFLLENHEYTLFGDTLSRIYII
jgi:hypothetical protein